MDPASHSGSTKKNRGGDRLKKISGDFGVYILRPMDAKMLNSCGDLVGPYLTRMAILSGL